MPPTASARLPPCRQLESTASSTWLTWSFYINGAAGPRQLPSLVAVVGGGASAEGSAKQRLERLIEREVKALFPAGTARRVALVGHDDDDAAMKPDEVTVRVFIDANVGEDDQTGLNSWAHTYQAQIRRLRPQLSLRIARPPVWWARALRPTLLEFTMEEAQKPAARARLTLPHDPALAEKQLSGDEIVLSGLGLLRAGYVSPSAPSRQRRI